MQPIKNTVYVCRDGSTADVTYGWEVSGELIHNQTGQNWVWYTRFAHHDASVATQASPIRTGSVTRTLICLSILPLHEWKGDAVGADKSNGYG